MADLAGTEGDGATMPPLDTMKNFVRQVPGSDRLAEITILAFAALAIAGAFGLHAITAEAKAEKLAAARIVDAIVAAGNAGHFENASKTVADFMHSVGPAAQTPGGLYFAGRPLFSARATLAAGDVELPAIRIGKAKEASPELLHGFGQVMLLVANVSPAEWSNYADAVVEAFVDPANLAEASLGMRDLGAAERERIERVMREGELGDQRAEALALVAATMRGDDLGDATRRIADSMRRFPLTLGGAIDKAAGLAHRLDVPPSRIENIERNLRTLRAGLGTEPVTAGGSERDLVIRTVRGEAGAEGEIGLTAVASVIRNRLQSHRFGASLRDVVTAPGQFDAAPTAGGYGAMARRLDDTSAEYEAIAAIVGEVLAGTRPDPTGGALYFYNPDLASPAWATRMATKTRIGDHVYGTVGEPFRARAVPLPGQTRAQYEAIIAAIEQHENASQRLPRAPSTGDGAS
jgi:hypothetical protein